MIQPLDEGSLAMIFGAPGPARSCHQGPSAVSTRTTPRSPPDLATASMTCAALGVSRKGR